jgi:alpha-tubulin suppressor-like RCC1 family protein
LSSTGSTWAWGANYAGELGLGGAALTTSPVAVPNLIGVTDISVGASHTMVRKSDGSLVAWGANYNGQLGDGSTSFRPLPVVVSALSNTVALAAGFRHSLAVDAAGAVWSWGWNQIGQLGNGSTVDSKTPTRIAGLADAISVGAGVGHSVSLRANGTVWAWGNNTLGQVGVDGTSDKLIPQQVPGLAQIVSIAVGHDHSLALTTDGNVWAWGSNNWGQLGDGSTVNRFAPAKVSGLPRIAAISTGGNHSLAIDSDGQLWAWGANDEGQLGNKLSTIATRPWRLPGFKNVAKAAGGSEHTVLLLRNGLLVSFGDNKYGELGVGTLARHSLPKLVVAPDTNGFLNLNQVAAPSIVPALNVPFFTAVSGNVTAGNALLKAKVRFRGADVGKNGSVFVTASVPSEFLAMTSVKGEPTVNRATGLNGTPVANAPSATPPTTFTLVQLTASGWQPVTNSQLIPFSTGVLGDQIAAQTILNNVDTSTLLGAEFCVGYSTSTTGAVTNGNMVVVATVPGAVSTGTCVVGGTTSITFSASPGWNLLGNPVNQTLDVAALFGDNGKVNSVWKWDSTSTNWQFFAPGMSTTEMQTYVAGQGYVVLNEIQPGDGFWVNAKVQGDLGTVSGISINLLQSSLASGWNLVATATSATPQDFNLNLSNTPPAEGQVPLNLLSLWAWDSLQSKWYFYAPSLDALGGNSLMDYVNSQGYKDFGATSKLLGGATGFWVNR